MIPMVRLIMILVYFRTLLNDEFTIIMMLRCSVPAWWIWIWVRHDSVHWTGGGSASHAGRSISEDRNFRLMHIRPEGPQSYHRARETRPPNRPNHPNRINSPASGPVHRHLRCTGVRPEADRQVGGAAPTRPSQPSQPSRSIVLE